MDKANCEYETITIKFVIWAFDIALLLTNQNDQN